MGIIDDILTATSATSMTLMGNASVDYRKASTLAVRSGLAAIVKYDDGSKPGGPSMPTGLHSIRVSLLNDAATGISISDDGPIIGDAILVAPAPGVTAKWCRIVKRIQASDTLVTWEVR